jgi:cyclase
MVFTGDSVFCGCQTWLMTSDVDQWLASLEIIRALDVDTVVPGHGPVTDLSYVDKQRAVLMSWKAAVAEAVAAGWTKDETQARVKFPELGQVDIGQEYMLEYVETLNAGSLFDKLSARAQPPVTPRS